MQYIHDEIDELEVLDRNSTLVYVMCSLDMSEQTQCNEETKY